jgi:hypothetical protein
MARPGRPERNRAARSFRQLKRFRHVINSDKVFGSHSRFFEQEFDKFSSSYRTDASAPIQNKVGAFLADPSLARMLTTPKREVRVRQAMDEGKVLIANLAKGRIGEDSSSLLGGLLVATLGLAAYTRVDTPPEKRRDFFVYIDEFQSFTTLALANMLSDNRKYRSDL